jgi:molecular chaperone GrpE
MSHELEREEQQDEAQTGEDSASSDRKVAEIEAQLKEEKNRYLYLYAEFENFKKRAFKERTDAAKYGWESVARDLLEVADNLERAVEHMPPTTDKAFTQGILMVLNQFKATLERQGVQPVESVGQELDPNLHEAVAQEPSEEPRGRIIQEHSKGYTLHGRLLRPARVVVSAGPA